MLLQFPVGFCGSEQLPSAFVSKLILRNICWLASFLMIDLVFCFQLFLICVCFSGFCCCVFCCVWLPGFCQAQFWQLLFWLFGTLSFRLSIYKLWWHLLKFLCVFSGMLLQLQDVFWCFILHIFRCPVYGSVLPLPVFLCVILCRHVLSFVCFPLFITRKRENLYIIYIRHTRIWVLEDSPFALGLSSLCLYYSTIFSFFNPECCIKQTKPFGTKRRTLS